MKEENWKGRGRIMWNVDRGVSPDEKSYGLITISYTEKMSGRIKI